MGSQVVWCKKVLFEVGSFHVNVYIIFTITLQDICIRLNKTNVHFPPKSEKNWCFREMWHNLFYDFPYISPAGEYLSHFEKQENKYILHLSIFISTSPLLLQFLTMASREISTSISRETWPPNWGLTLYCSGWKCTLLLVLHLQASIWSGSSKELRKTHP